MKKSLEAHASTPGASNGVAAEPETINCLNGDDEEEFDVDARLTPPPVAMRKIKVKLKYMGWEEPRIFFDPDKD
jgi:hypothetical protein